MFRFHGEVGEASVSVDSKVTMLHTSLPIEDKLLRLEIILFIEMLFFLLRQN